MHICLDIDDTITYQPEFFARLTTTFSDARISVVSFRTDFDEAKRCLDELGIRYDKLIVSSDADLGAKKGEQLKVCL